MSKQHYHISTYRAQASIGYLVKRSHSLILDMIEPVLEQHGFSFVQYVILGWLRDGIAVNPRDICAQYRHNSGAMTRVVDQLCERGLLERARRGVDRRKVELQLTPAGREAIENLIPLVIEKLNLALGDFTTHEVEELQRLLVKMNTKLQAIVEPGAGQPGAGQPGADQPAAGVPGAVPAEA
jgi:DNA-binding MarR family transcriptional regulator